MNEPDTDLTHYNELNAATIKFGCDMETVKQHAGLRQSLCDCSAA